MNHTLGRKVSVAKMHTPIFIPAIGNLPDTLQRTSGGAGKLGDLVMTLLSTGIYLTVGGKEAFIPLTQVQVLTLEAEEDKKA